jgi:hypothetical protein
MDVSMTQLQFMLKAVGAYGGTSDLRMSTYALCQRESSL